MKRLLPLVPAALALTACVTDGNIGDGDSGVNVDGDGDGFTVAEGDCDDSIPAFNPAQTDIVGDGLDQNCDGIDGTDLDGDEHASAASGGLDCDDNAAGVNPGAEEVPNDDVDQDCNGFDGVLDSFVYEPPEQVDLLLVIDNSCSMSEEQGRLTASFPALFDALDDAEWRIGVVSTDMDDFSHSGKLQGDPVDPVPAWVDRDDGDRLESLTRAADLGTWGAADEKGRAAAYAALETRAQTDNAGFRRDEAHLATFVLSDEDDYSGFSPIDLQGFIDWYTTSFASASFHALVGPDPVCTDAWETGTDYLAAVDAVGGTAGSICEPSYDDFMTDMAGSALAGSVRIVLSVPPQIDTIEVTVTPVDGSPAPNDQWTYDEALSMIRFDPRPAAGSVIDVRYDPASEAR